MFVIAQLSVVLVTNFNRVAVTGNLKRTKGGRGDLSENLSLLFHRFSDKKNM